MKDREAKAVRVLAYVLQQNAQPAKAAILLEALDALDPNGTQTLIALAVAQLQSLEPSRALETLQRIGADHGKTGVIDLLRAQALTQLGRSTEAQVAMKDFLARGEYLKRSQPG